MLTRLIDLAERGCVPDALVRRGIRLLLAARLRQVGHRDPAAELEAVYAFADGIAQAPVAVGTGAANEQHYEVPAAFFEQVLGPHMKYSSCLWDGAGGCLGDAEAAMLALTCERAQLADGQQVLELGCGWGSLTLWMAAHYPQSRITAVSNSASQRRHILERARTRGLGNVQVLTADMAHFRPPDRYDRVVSVEMFEHMRNWPELLRRIRSWMQPGARALVHVFCHRTHSYLFETGGRTDWMGRYFFTGGMMPAESLMLHCQDDLRVRHHWRVNGRHYARTLRAWLENMDARRPALLPVLAQAYGETDARRWFGRWRLFMMACEELFAWRGGTEWYVAQYLLAPRETSPAP